MNDDHVDALARAAADGVDFDGLRVSAGDDGFAVSVGDHGADGLSRAELHRVATHHAAHVTNWYFWHAVAPQKADRWAFLRWIEGADERPVPERYDALGEVVHREWGQLRIAATVDDDGDRHYGLRHVDDADRPAGDLTVYADPVEAREIATRDDRDRYRPLKTAPSLRAGWLFPDLTAAELLTAVEAFYPATVANWHREREGELDVTHWRPTAERQTGIYDVVDELDRDAVERIAGSCCVDSQCLKRREWEFDEGEAIAADGGSGAFPCREPCSLVIAAARKWTYLEREEPRTYEFELTPSEKEQLEETVAAVAEGRTDEIREADVGEGANRYRARYMREKLFDEDGNLGGVPTEHEESH